MAAAGAGVARDAASPFFLAGPVDAKTFPATGVEPRTAQRVLEGLRSLDATPRLNLASFVTTFMEPECRQVMDEAINVNYIDTEEYPSTEKIKDMCVSMLADLWHADPSSPPTGTDTVGSSEAVLLGGLALKRRWQDRRRAAGLDAARPNIVMGTETHVVWEKLTRYMEIEPRWVANRPGVYVASNKDLVAACDENTIGVVAILGTTYTGDFYDVEGLDRLVAAKNAEKGWRLRIHVDAASGGFVAPFAFPDLKWDFRLPNVASINASGHKFGLVFPGLGWVMWRDRASLPDSLVFHDAYLGKDQITITLNFSKSAMNVVGQLYQFVRLGFSGYKAVNEHMQQVAVQLRAGLEQLGFEIISSGGGKDARPALPLVAFHLPDATKDSRFYTEYHLAERLRMAGWVIPAYALAKDNGGRTVLRVVCRWDLSATLVAELLEDFTEALAWLDTHAISVKPAATAATAATAAKAAKGGEGAAAALAAAVEEGEEEGHGGETRAAKRARLESDLVLRRWHERMGLRGKC